MVYGLWDANGLLTAQAKDLILETYLSGPSTRRVGKLLERVLGYEVSAGTVSAICRGLDDLVRQYWRSPIDDDWEYLLLDAVVVKNRSAVGSEKRNEKACLDGARLIYLAPNCTEAAKRFRAWRDRWVELEPKAVACLEADIEDMLEFFSVPHDFQRTMRTTNPIERVFRPVPVRPGLSRSISGSTSGEVRRRTRTISRFTNRRSVDRMLYAVLAYQNRQWDEAYRPKQFTHKT